jgi:predicted nucleic acid-binding protein
MRRLPKRVVFDPPALIEINRRRNRDILEFVLAEFDVFVPFSSLHAYLLGKAYLGRDVEEDLSSFEEIYHTVYPDRELLVKLVTIEASLIKEGVFMSLEDLLTGVSTIVLDAFLVSTEPERFKPLKKYGLDCMGLEKFFEEVSELAREEIKKRKSRMSVNPGK